MLEKIAAGEGTTASTGASTSPKFVLDRYICAMARFQVACSARLNDLQHTSPGGLQTHRNYPGTPGMADKDSECFQDQEEPSAADCTALLLYRTGLVVHPSTSLGPPGRPGQVQGHGLPHSNSQLRLYRVDPPARDKLTAPFVG